jgi:hypothetical protein
VLDNKPRHLIVRPLPDGSLLQRDGKIVYTMIDFELLQRHEDTAPQKSRRAEDGT